MINTRIHIVALLVVTGFLLLGGCGRESDLDDLADLNTAIYQEDVGLVKAILAEKPKLINARQFPAGRTPLHNAAYNGSNYVVKLLIAEGAEIDALDDHEQTPLHCACNYGRPGNVRLLVNKGADINAVDERGRTPLHGVGRRKWFEQMGGGNFTPDHKGVAQILLSMGVQTQIKDQYGRTPLDYAILNDETNIVNIIKEHASE